MDLNKSREFFDPEDLGKSRCHIIGCGAIGSAVAELLVRAGITRITLYDEDIVAPHNLANQLFYFDDIGERKTKALADKLIAINPADFKINPNHLKLENNFTDQIVSGYIFLCVDNIDTRRMIVENNMYNNNLKAIIDLRMRLKDGVTYLADWRDTKEKQNLLNSMQFTHEEALKETPVSACGFTLSVAPTVRAVAAYGVANFMNFTKNEDYARMAALNVFGMYAEGYYVHK